MKYQRLTPNKLDALLQCNDFAEMQSILAQCLERLKELEDKIDNGELVFAEKLD